MRAFVFKLLKTVQLKTVIFVALLIVATLTALMAVTLHAILHKIAMSQTKRLPLILRSLEHEVEMTVTDQQDKAAFLLSLHILEDAFNRNLNLSTNKEYAPSNSQLP